MVALVQASDKLLPERLAATSRFGKFRPETEQMVRKIEVKDDQNLITLKTLFDKFEFMGKRSRDFPATDYNAACKVIKSGTYSATQITAFSLVLHSLESAVKAQQPSYNLDLFRNKIGVLFSALINLSQDSDFHLVSQNVANPMNYLGYLNTKSIMVSGDIGDYLGISMQSGKIIIDGNAKDETGQGMTDGNIIVEGNTGHWTGNLMNGGSIEIFGNTATGLGKLMDGGVIRVHEDAGDGIADTASNARIYIDGDMGKLGERFPSVLIYHKGKFVRKGPFMRSAPGNE